MKIVGTAMKCGWLIGAVSLPAYAFDEGPFIWKCAAFTCAFIVGAAIGTALSWYDLRRGKSGRLEISQAEAKGLEHPPLDD